MPTGKFRSLLESSENRREIPRTYGKFTESQEDSKNFWKFHDVLKSLESCLKFPRTINKFMELLNISRSHGTLLVRSSENFWDVPNTSLRNFESCGKMHALMACSVNCRNVSRTTGKIREPLGISDKFWEVSNIDLEAV